MLLLLVVIPHYSVDCVWDVVHHDVQIHLVIVALSKEVVFHLYHVRVVKLLHDLQLPVFEAFVLKDLFDCHNLACLLDFGLVDHTKCTVADNLFCIVSEGLLK